MGFESEEGAKESIRKYETSARQRRICPLQFSLASAFLSLSLSLTLFARNVSSFSHALGFVPTCVVIAISPQCSDAIPRTRRHHTGSHAHTHARARAHTRTLNGAGERRKSARTVADAPRTRDGVLGIARPDRGRDPPPRPRNKSFLRRHRSSL